MHQRLFLLVQSNLFVLFNHVQESERKMALLDLQGMEWKEEARGGGDQTNLCVDVSDVSVSISL